MSDILQEIIFPKSGLNTDDSNLFAPLGDSPYRLNILVGEEGANGIVTNMKGNHLSTYRFDLTLANVYQVAGSYYNQLTRKCYFFVFSQPYDFSSSDEYLYDNHLLVFDEDTEVITNVFTDEKNYFGINLNTPVKDCDMLGDRLYFNPRVSEPKMIDVVRAKNYMDYDAWQASPVTYLYGNRVRFFGGIFLANKDIVADHSPSTHPDDWDRISDTYQDETDLTPIFDSEFHYAFNVIRHIPVYRPICAYGSDLTKYANNVRGKLFRFTHRYKFFDDTYSLFGAYSDVVLPVNDEYYNGEVPGNINLYNYISVSIPLHSASLIKEIDIIFQETGGDWKRAKLINRWDQELLDDVYYTYKFYNLDAAYEVIDQTLLEEPYDSVPRTAGTQELINKNILTYGRCREGFNNIDKNDIDVSLTPDIVDISVANTISVIRRDSILSEDIVTYPGGLENPYNIAWKTSIDLLAWFPGGVATNDIFRVTINGIQKEYVITAGEADNITAFIDALVNHFLQSAIGYPALVWTGDVASSSININSIPNITEWIVFKSGVAEAALTKKRGFKSGAWHPFCIFYYDGAMRRWDAQTSKTNIDAAGYTIDGTTVYVPMLSEYSPQLDTTAHKWNIEWEVNHTPPVGAKWWRWGYAGNSLASYFVQYIIEAINDNSPWTRMDIAPLQILKFAKTDEATWNEFPQSSIDPYVWQAGDRVRFITEKSTATELGIIVDGVYDYEILKYEETTDTPPKYYIYVQDFDFTTANIGIESLIEIYRPKKTTTAVEFFEFGELMPIIEDTDHVMVHGAGVVGEQNQDTLLGLPAKGTFYSGDVYHILRTPSLPIDGVEGYFHESMWYSDFYNSDDYDKGRNGVETSFGERILNIIRYSNQYLQNTGINGLSTFEGDHYKELADIYGDIVSTVEVGTTLKVYMEKKSASILIGRQEYNDTGGNIVTVTSTVVLGSVRYPEDTFGTQWIESVCKNNRWVYGFDVFNAVMWRDSANGLFPISGRYEAVGGGTGDYKMASWFKDKADALMLSGITNVMVMSVWDEKYKNLYVTFRDKANSANSETIVYHEPSNRWICFTDFEQTPAGGYGEMLELSYSIVHGFAGGIGYEFDEETRFAIFNLETALGAEDLMPTETFIVDEDGTTFILWTDDTTFIID